MSVSRAKNKLSMLDFRQVRKYPLSFQQVNEVRCGADGRVHNRFASIRPIVPIRVVTQRKSFRQHGQSGGGLEDAGKAWLQVIAIYARSSNARRVSGLSQRPAGGRLHSGLRRSYPLSSGLVLASGRDNGDSENNTTGRTAGGFGCFEAPVDGRREGLSGHGASGSSEAAHPSCRDARGGGERQRLDPDQASLELREAQLLSPARIEELARQQQFVDPAQTRVPHHCTGFHFHTAVFANIYVGVRLLQYVAGDSLDVICDVEANTLKRPLRRAHDLVMRYFNNSKERL